MSREKANGLVLALLGLVVLIERKTLIQSGWVGFWPLFIIAWGLILFFEYFSFKEKKLIGCAFFLTCGGTFMLLFTLGYLQWKYLTIFWPFFLMLFGFSFLLPYTAGLTETGFLTTGGFFLAAGILLLLAELTSSTAGLGTVWPVLIIIIALLLITGLFEVREKSGKTGRF